MDTTVKILEDSTTITGFYDKEADVLYISLGEPREGVAVDISDGAIARYHEDSETIVGITLIGLRQRVLKELNHKLHVAPHPNGWAVTEENVESSIGMGRVFEIVSFCQRWLVNPPLQVNGCIKYNVHFR